MFHGVIHKITLAQFFLRHGVVGMPLQHQAVHTWCAKLFCYALIGSTDSQRSL